VAAGASRYEGHKVLIGHFTRRSSRGDLGADHARRRTRHRVRLLAEPYLRELHDMDFDGSAGRVGRFVPDLGGRVRAV